MLFSAIIFFFLHKITPAACRTHEDGYFPGHVERTILNMEWISCMQACHDEPSCISYNFFKRNQTCEINTSGLKQQCDSRSVIYSRGWIFHQIRPVPEEIPEPGLGDHPSKPAKSCAEIFSSRPNVPSGAYYIRISDKTRLIYCKMEYTAECGDGGWTLAMKINGSKGTFSYTSNLWKNLEPYNEEGGKDLNHTETKFAFFGTADLKEGLCVGMNVNSETKWLKIPYPSNTLFGIFDGDMAEILNIDRAQWKSLISGSSMHDACTPKDGFNVGGDDVIGAKARIGLIGYKDCGNPAVSRIGFGTQGDSGGMDPNNSCGNEATADADNGIQSIKAFCYILIK